LSDSGNEETVATLRKCFDKTRCLGGVVEGGAYFVDGGAEAVVEIDEGIRGPQFVADLISGDDLAGTFEKHNQKIEGLRLKPDFMALAAQLTRVKMRSKRTEEDDFGLGHELSAAAKGTRMAWAGG